MKTNYAIFEEHARLSQLNLSDLELEVRQRPPVAKVACGTLPS